MSGVAYYVGYCAKDGDGAKVCGQKFSTRKEAMHTNLVGMPFGYPAPGWRYRSDTGELFCWPGCDNPKCHEAIKAWLKERGYTVNGTEGLGAGPDDTFNRGKGSAFHRAHGYYKRGFANQWDYQSIGDSTSRQAIDSLFEGWSGSSTTNYWMDAAGKPTQVDSHAEGAYTILGVEKLGESPYHAMFNKGYCRIVIDRYADAIYVEKTSALTKEQRAKLEDWCVERQMPLIRTDLYGPSEKVMFNPPPPPLPVAEATTRPPVTEGWAGAGQTASAMQESLPEPEEPDMDFYCGWVKTSGEVSNVSGADNKDDNGHRDVPDEVLERSVPHDGSVYNPWRYRGDLQEVFFWYPATNTQKEAVKKWLKTKGCQVKYFDTIYSKVGQNVSSMDSRSMRVHDIAHGAPSYRQRIGDSVEEGWTGSGVTNYWLSRSGQLIKVQGHLLGAINILHLSAPPKDGSEGAAYEMMFSAGYVRVVVEHDNYSIEVDAGDRGLNRAQTDTLKDLAIERHARLVLTTFPADGGRITKTIYDPSEVMAEGEEEPVAKFHAVQSGFGLMPDIELWNLTRDIPGHPKDSTVSRTTLEKYGYKLPPAPRQEAVVGRPTKWYLTKGNPDKEHIISAGVMDSSGNIHLGDGHAEARVEAGYHEHPDEPAGHVNGVPTYIEGFYTSWGRFVNRREAMKVAELAAQFPKKMFNKVKDLGSCSEDYRYLFEEVDTDWRKIAIGGNAKMNRYWMSKDGKLTHVISHESGATKLRPDLFPKEMFPNGVASTRGASELIYGKMFKEGYARVTTDTWDSPMIYAQRGCYGDTEGRPHALSNAQARVLKDMAIEMRASLVLDANGKTTYLYQPEQELPEAFSPEEPDTPFKKRLGRCYEIAGRAALNNPGVTLVHGSIQKGPNPRIGHAWCEIPCQLPPEQQEKLRKGGWEPEPEIYEPTSNNVYPKDFFMAYHNAKEDQRYAPDELCKKILQAKHWGPWGEASGIYGPMKGSRKRKAKSKA